MRGDATVLQPPRYLDERQCAFSRARRQLFCRQAGHRALPEVIIRNFGLGSQRSAIRIIFRHVSLCRWLRRRRQRSQWESTW
jgi:hypothetical protein